jgi:RNA polymerase sigma-70 factor, ECF subfamily
MAIADGTLLDIVMLNNLDQQAFGALVEPHRRELQAHAYRMLGSVQEAEDLVQDTFLRAWQRRETYAGRAPLRAWLYRIATNLCLDRLDQRQQPGRTLPQARQGPAGGSDPLPPAILEPVWLEPYPDELLAPDDVNPESRYALSESVTLAFMTSLQLLPARQRAVLILRDVLDWPASEAADLLDLSVPAVKSALHRARTTLSAHYDTVQFERLSLNGLDANRQQQLDRYARAWEMADVDGLAALLKADATFSMPPNPLWVRGVDDIRALVGRAIFGGQVGRWRLVPTRANGEAGFGLYRINDQDGVYHAYGVQVVSFDGDRIAAMTTFRVPALVKYFHLPDVIPEK